MKEVLEVGKLDVVMDLVEMKVLEPIKHKGAIILYEAVVFVFVF